MDGSEITAECAVCGKQTNNTVSVCVTLSMEDVQGTQSFYIHKECLKLAFPKMYIFHPDFIDE
jgi:hypothetical protein